MELIDTISYVFDAVERTKATAADFRTNLLLDRRKLEPWIERQDMLAETCDGCAFFLRKDRDFFHLYFCAADTSALARGFGISDALRAKPLVIDVLQNRGEPTDLAEIMGQAGFRPYNRLQRMFRMAPLAGGAYAKDESVISYAEPSDLLRILELLECSFDRFASQLPTLDELKTAVSAQQILLARSGPALAALLIFETQGLTSAVRFWLVTEDFRGQRYGSTLIRHYFDTQDRVRRFILWVLVDNADAIRKYEHYGYAPDGLIDQVFVNGMIRA